MNDPYRTNPPCDHGVIFDKDECCKLIKEHNSLYQYEADNQLLIQKIRNKWPRLDGLCPKGCSYYGIAYASLMHYLMGDW